MTLSNRYLLERGRTKPDRVLTAVRTRPSIRIDLRGLIIAHTSGNALQSIFFLTFFVSSAEEARVVAFVPIVCESQEYFLDALMRKKSTALAWHPPRRFPRLGVAPLASKVWIYIPSLTTNSRTTGFRRCARCSL